MNMQAISISQNPKAASANEEDSASELALVLRMLGFLKPVWKTAIIAALIVMGRAIAEVVTVHFLSPAITAVSGSFTGGQGAANGSPGFWDWLGGSALLEVLPWMAGAQLCLGVLVYFRHVWDAKLSMHAVFFMRQAIYDRLQCVGFSFHDRMTSGQLINRALSDLQSVRSFVNMSLLTTLDITVSVLAYMTLLWSRSHWLMLAALTPIPFWLLVIRRFTRISRPLYRAQQEASDRLMTALTENVAGVQVVRAFGTQAQESRKYNLLTKGLLRRLFAVIRLQAHLTPTLKAIATASHIALFVLASWLILKDRISVGDLMILGVAMSSILSKLQQVNGMTESYQTAVVSARRIFEVLDTPAVISPERKHPKIIVPRGRIDFSEVSFGYDPKLPVLKNVSATLPGGGVTAILGPTGSGKTTFASLIARFYDPQHGTISIDGQDLRTVDVKSLRRKVGFVFQETFLFSDTIRNNIRYGRKDVSEEMLRAAARAAHADEFIETLPLGYDTPFGERGVQLSGGQKQRLALARALVYDPRILVLDDATASLDAKTEQSVHAMLEPLFEGRTVLVIAHRISSVQSADHILVLQNGRISQAGAHEDLLAQEGHYRNIARMQSLSAKEEPRAEILSET